MILLPKSKKRTEKNTLMLSNKGLMQWQCFAGIAIVAHRIVARFIDFIWSCILYGVFKQLPKTIIVLSSSKRSLCGSLNPMKLPALRSGSFMGFKNKTF